MSLFYSLAYRIGFRPWENAATHPAAAGHIISLFDREERGREPPFGKALDVGCGTGHWSIVLARRGWEVTGVELNPRAVQMARERVLEEGSGARIVEGDVTALDASGIGGDFRFVWDFGTIHGLNDAQRKAAGGSIDKVASRDASLVILAWTPGRRGPLPRGMSRDELLDAFQGWRITDEEPFDATGLPGPLRNADPRIYRLERAT